MNRVGYVFETQKAHQYVLRQTNALQRIAYLRKLKSAIQENEDAIYFALHKDLRKSRFEASITELFFVYGEIDFAISNLRSWMSPKRIGKTMSNPFAKNRIYYEPKGVCLIIAPWNYPFQLVMSPLISAIAAGNCVMVKPSELSPAMSKIITKILLDTFEEEHIACFEGDVDLNALLGDYNKTNETFGITPYGPYTTSISSVNQLTPTSGTIVVENIFDFGWGPITFTLDWSDPNNRTVIVVAQSSGIADAGTLSGAYAGEEVAVRPFAGQPGTFSACKGTLTLKMQLGVAGLGYFGELYTVNMAR